MEKDDFLHLENRDPEDLREAVELNERLRELDFPVLSDDEIKKMNQLLEDYGWR